MFAFTVHLRAVLVNINALRDTVQHHQGAARCVQTPQPPPSPPPPLPLLASASP